MEFKQLSALEFHLPVGSGEVWNGRSFREDLGVCVEGTSAPRFEPEQRYSEVHTCNVSGTGFQVEWFLYESISYHSLRIQERRSFHNWCAEIPHLKRASFSLCWGRSIKPLLSRISIMFLFNYTHRLQSNSIFWLMDCSLLSRKAKMFVLTACPIQLWAAYFFSCLGGVFLSTKQYCNLHFSSF